MTATGIDVWDAHVAAVANDVTRQAMLTGRPGYLPRHARNDRSGELSLGSVIGHAIDAARRAEQAVEVLAATDHLPASRLLYRELHRAGALTNTARVAS